MYPKNYSLLFILEEESGGITFSGDAQASVEGDVDTRNDTISDEDVDTRFINLPGFDLNAFAGQVRLIIFYELRIRDVLC